MNSAKVKKWIVVHIFKIDYEINSIYEESNFTSITKSWHDEVADYLMMIVPILLLVSGTTFNSLSIAVSRRPSLNDSTASFLFIILAISDMLSLHLGMSMFTYIA